MKTAYYLSGVRNTLESLILSCDIALVKAKALGLKEDEAVISYKDLKETFEYLLKKQTEDLTNDQEVSQ